MLSYFHREPQPPPPDVDVAVLNAMDVGPKDITLTMGIVVHAVLDVEILKHALYLAIEQKLPRAGARLALRNGIYEFHIPRTFSDDTPPARFTHAHRDETFARAGLCLPPDVPSDAQHAPYIVDAPMASAALFRGPATPREAHDFLVPGTPLVHVHVTVLADATLIGTTTTHAMFDAHGFRVLFDAWTAALRGELAAVPATPREYAPFVQIARDTLPTPRPADQPKRAFFALGLLGTAHFLVRFLWRVLRDPRERTKLLYVPQAWLAGQKDACTAQLGQVESKEYVSSSDVLVASVCKMLYATRTDATPVHIHIPVNLRPMLREYLPHPYPHNAVADCAPVRAPTAAQLGAQSVLETALSIRRAVAAFKANRGTLLAELAWEQRAGPGVPLFPAPPGGEWLVATNWRASKLNEVDFAGARVAGETRDARAQFVIGCVQEGIKVPLRGGVVVHSESAEGIWLAIVQSEKVWERVRRSGSMRFA